MKNIIARHSSYIISDFDPECAPLKLMNELSIYNARCFRRDPLGMVYDKEKGELRIPRGYSDEKLSKLLNRDIDIDDSPNKADNFDLKLKSKPKDGTQLSIIKFLCGLGDTYKYTRKHSQLFIDSITGSGKTYCVITATAYFQKKILILVPSMIGKMKEQWKSEFLKHSNATEDDILIVDGSKECLKILDNKYKDKSIFIMGRSTALSFSKKYSWNKFEEVIENMHVGIKLVDEVHLDFDTNVKIDCYTNVKRTFYSTASPGRGDKSENKIFKKIFHNVPIMGAELKNVKDNYIIMMIFKYYHSATNEQRLGCKTKEGLSTALYSSYLIDKKGARYEFFTALDTAIKSVYCKYKDATGKLLILGATRELLNTINRFLKKNYPQFSVGLYTSDVPDRKERELELNNNIILATDKGLGTGSDISDLQVMINIIPYSNWIYADQLCGRLRKNGKNVFYIELVNMDFPEAASQYNERSKFLCKKAKDGKLIVQKCK